MRLCKAFACAAVLIATAAAAPTPDLIADLPWRCVGPAVMGGRISDLAAVPGDPSLVYAASGSGGLFRTENAGITWESIFDRQSTISIGAIAIEPANPKVVWVGTGESNLRNSVSFGDGVYKSTDGGISWTHVGLVDTQTISRIVIDPKNPNHVLVAAVGHAFGPNAERGVFATEDGGRTWKKTLFVDPEHGAVGLEMDPADPKIVYAGMWRFDRKPWTYSSGSEQGGVFRSRDGGATWRKITAGLPSLLGRISIKIAPADSKTVYVIAESKEGTLFRSNDKGESFVRVSSDRELVGRAYYFTDLRVAPDHADHIMVLSDALLESRDGGKHFSRMSPGIHGDLHALWIDPKDSRRIWQGNDGGLAVTYDAGKHWEQVNNIPLGQLYHVSADDRAPFYQVTVGMQDNGSWTGPSRTHEPGGIFNDDWRMLNPFTGFASLHDPDNPDILITEQPGGALLRTDLRTHEQQVISPQPRSFGGAPASAMPYRFNWDAPLVRSPFGKHTMYLAGNVIFQSSDSGRSWEAMSHDLTNADSGKLGNVGGPISVDNSASEVYSTITSLAESPAKRNLLWVGTDDGNLQRSVDGGGTWTNLIGNVPGIPSGSPISHVEPAVKDEHSAYISVDRHMFDDPKPYIFKSTDDGRTWREISSGLPANAFVWTIRQDPQQGRLLYAGTELGLYGSFDDGASWMPLHGDNMPSAIAIRNIVFQPQSNDLLVATHGRSLWILDDLTQLQELAAAEVKAGLLPIRTAFRYAVRPTRFGFGDKTYLGANPPYGAELNYLLTGDVQTAKFEIVDQSGQVVQTMPVKKGRGLHQAVWNLRYAGPSSPGGGRGRESQGPQALPGTYTARLTFDGVASVQTFKVKLDQSIPAKESDLQAQFEMARDLTSMRKSVVAAIGELSAAPEATDKEELLGELRRPAGSGRSESPARLQEDLESLFAMVDGVDAAPTVAQSAYFHNLKARFDTVMSAIGERKKALP